MKTEAASGVVPITARLPYEVHRKLRFLAADSGVSMNTMLIKLLTAAMADNRAREALARSRCARFWRGGEKVKKKFELGEDVIRALKDIISINDDCQGAPLVTVKKCESEERERLVQSWKEQALGGDDDETEID